MSVLEGLWESLWRALTTWRPQPVAPPVLDPELPRMSALRRAAEILHYQLASLEHALSPSGTLRAFLRLCAVLGLLLTMPVLLIVPPLVGLFYGLADMIAALTAVCMNILQCLLTMAGIAVIGWLLLAMICRR